MDNPVGVLALQGSYEAHGKVLTALGRCVREVRTPEDLAGIDALCMPGGESTTMSLLLDSSGLREPLTTAIRDGLPVLATCAGVILLARELRGDSGSIKVKPLGLLEATVDRNAYGRQVDSFLADLRIDWPVLGSTEADSTFHGVFIRAPKIIEPGPDTVPVAFHGIEPVAFRQGNIIAAAFHPEMAGDTRFHHALLGFNQG